MTRGRFITLEGIEGAGKSTAARFISEWLASRAISARLTREPGGTPLAESIRKIVLERGDETITPASETLLMFAGRGVHLENLVRPALNKGEWVICDRFTDATRAYQGAGRGVSAELIETLAAAVHADLQPDCTLLLDLPVALGLERARKRGQPVDRFESEREQFFERVRAAYLDLARQDPKRISIVDASAPLDTVKAQIVAVLTQIVASPTFVTAS
jgi:dTMP kinase